MPIYNLKPKNIIAPNIGSMQDSYDEIPLNSSLPSSPPLSPGSPPPPSPPPPPAVFWSFYAIVCDPQPTQTPIIANDPETWGEWTGPWHSGSPIKFLGYTAATWNTLYTPAVGDFFTSHRLWINPDYLNPDINAVYGTNPNGPINGHWGWHQMLVYSMLIPAHRLNVNGKYTMWEVTSMDLYNPAGGTRRKDPHCLQGVRWRCNPATPTSIATCTTHAIGTPGAIHISYNACMADPNCGTYPPSYVCSGASGAVDPNGTTIAPWNCYDDGQGTGNPNQTACQTACIAPIPDSYFCSGASGAGHPQGTPWACYDDGSGTGNPSQNACQLLCQPLPPPPTYNCSGASGVGHPNGTPWACYDPGTGLGTHTGANAWNDCQLVCIPPPPTYNCSNASGIGHPQGTPWTCYDPGTGMGVYTGLNALTTCQSFCQPPPESWDCSQHSGVTLPSGQIIPPWTCYDPGTGLGQFPTQNDCQTAIWGNPNHPLYGLPVCQPVPESYNCHLPWIPGQGYAAVGTCSDPMDGSGQYSVANGYSNPYQDCVDACRDVRADPPLGGEISWNCVNLIGQQYGSCTWVNGTSGQYTTEQDCLDACIDVRVDPILTGGDCKICCCEPYQTSPGMPWMCIPGTQTLSIPTLSPCSCAMMGMIDCTEDVGMGQEGYNCLPNGTCVYTSVAPIFTAATAALNLNPATPGINYPNSLAGALAYCEDSCQPVLGAFCTPLLSCPCGWDDIPGGCEFTSTSGTFTMPFIEKCFGFPNNVTPLPGDAWFNVGSFSNISWNKAYVVGSGIPITSTPTLETPTQCN